MTASHESIGKSAGSDESLFRQVPVPGNCARVLPLKVVPVPGQVLRYLMRHQHVQTGARAREPGTGS